MEGETEEDYLLALNMLRQALPDPDLLGCIVSDRCLAQRAAINQIFSNANHQMCGFHVVGAVTKNARLKLPENIQFQNFVQKFKELLYEKNIEVAHKKMQDLLEEFPEMSNYLNKEWFPYSTQWLQCYVSFFFNLGMRSSQRAESMNGALKSLQSKTLPLANFLNNVETVCLRQYRVYKQTIYKEKTYRRDEQNQCLLELL